MKVIELLNKIANGEETPDKVRYGGIIYTKAVDYVTKEVIDYLNKCESLFEINDGFEYCFINKYLNDEVEIIEEDKKIEHIGANNYEWNYRYDSRTPQAVVDNLELVRQKINEIIKHLNKGE